MATRAKSYEELKSLVQLCKTGHLFEVQIWIADGRPIDPPVYTGGRRSKNPLEVAIAQGFHSLVLVLLKGGATISDNSYNALEHALAERRFDLIKLLVEYGADIASVDMISVFDSWDPEIMEYFIEQGADVETGDPLAVALCDRIRTALGVFKRHQDRFPSFQEQLNTALRFHCKEGDLKWVSLLLWAGADPFAKGVSAPGEEPESDPDDELCALESAALNDHFEIFKLKKIKIAPDHPIAYELVRYACRSKDGDFLLGFLEKGFNPVKKPDQGTSLIQTYLCHLPMVYDGFWFDQRGNNNDSNEARETIKKIHLLAKHGAQWVPSERYEINDARRALLKMTADYTTEFVWIMSQFKACSRENIEQLLKTTAIRRHIAKHQSRINELLRGSDG